MKEAATASDADLAVIAARAAGWRERRGGGAPADETPEDAALTNARLARWKRLVADGDAGRFMAYLSLHGLDETTARCAVTPRREAAGPLPCWTATLRECLREFQADNAPAPTAGDLGRPLPFEEFLAPFARVAWQRATSTADGDALLSDAARADLVRSFTESLGRLCWPTLELEFTLFRSAGQSDLDQFFGGAAPADSRELYDAFLDSLTGRGLAAFFREYSVLGRLAASLVDTWAEATGEFLRRLASDRADMRVAFGDGADLGPVASIETGLSDPHRGGRVVHIIQFASRLKLVYKPKDPGLEGAWWDLLAWCNREGAPLPFKVLRILDRPGYGWVEFAEHLPCADDDAARRYYRRAGMLLALLHGLNGTDVHFENIIACGEHPVLIDVEMLLQSSPAPRGDEDSACRIHGPLSDSVLHTGLLPSWTVGLDGEAYDTSGLAPMPGNRGAADGAPWEHVNTDAMTIGDVYEEPNPARNGPRVGDRALSPDDYVEEVVGGFTAMYKFLTERREQLLAADGPLERFRRLPVRFVYRATRQYGLLLWKTRHPRFMREGIERAVEFEMLRRPLTSSPERPADWAVLEDEAAALERLDVPYFTVDSSETALRTESGEVLERFFEGPGFDRALARLRSFNGEDCRRQAAVIRGSFHARAARAAGLADEVLEEPPPGAAPLTGAEWLTAAARIARELRERAILSADGACWLGLEYLFEADQYRLRPTDVGLYNGGVGVGLFLAALEKATGGAGFRDLAEAALRPARRFFRTRPPTAALRAMGVGAASGMGAVVYGLTRAAGFLGAPELQEDARRVAGWMTDDVIAADKTLDVIGGSAGAVLALLALHHATGDAGVLERAAACGRRLLECRTAAGQGPRAWMTIKAARPLTGFAHGAAGVACALAGLAAATGEGAFLKAAREGVEYERSVFSPSRGNWPDFREPVGPGAEPPYRTSWCHGAPGIALARLARLTVLDDATVREDIEHGLAATGQAGVQGVDHLCCGNMGRIDVLLEASRRLGRPGLREDAERQAARVVRAAEAAGAFRLFANLPRGVYTPGLFQGAAGVGYELLRLADPEAFPSVLLMD